MENIEEKKRDLQSAIDFDSEKKIEVPTEIPEPVQLEPEKEA
jgi:hypothetical protein